VKTKILSVSMALALIAILVAPLAVFAQTSADTTITGTVGAALTVAAPTTINLPPLVPGTVVSSAPQSVTVTTNTAGWTLTVVESGASPDGQMSGAAGPLANAMTVDGGVNGNPAPLNSPVTLVSNGAAGGSTINDVVFSQQVAANAAPGTYSIIVTFTANPGT
jgi:hypothetical protein